MALDIADPQVQQGLTTTDRVLNLQHNGYGFLPTQLLFSLANSGLSDQDIRTKAEALRTASLAGDTANAFATQAKKTGNTAVQISAKRIQQRADDGFKVFFDDPVLQKAPSAALALKQYISGAIGSWPVAGGTVAHTQQQLQLRGYGHDLQVTGAWSPEWQNAHSDYANAMFNSQLAGNKPGSTSLGHAMQALQALMPVSAFDAITGFILHAPGMLRDALIHSAGGFAAGGAALYGSIAHGNIQQGINEGAQAQANVVSTLETAAGHPVSAKEYRNRTDAQILTDTVSDVNTVLMLSTAFGTAGRLAKALGEAKVPLTVGEAGEAGGVVTNTLRGPQTLMRTFNAKAAVDPVTGAVIPGQMVAQRLGRTVVGAALGAAVPGFTGRPGEEVLAGAGLGGLAGFVSTTNAFNTKPILGRLGMSLDALADQEGLYYKARNWVAAPYRWELGGIKPVQLAGDVLQEGTMFGAKVRGLAAAQNQVAPSSTAQGIEDEHWFDTVNDAVKHRLDFTVLGAHIAPSLDDLQLFLHGTPMQTRNAIGSSVDHFKVAYEQALSEPGWAAGIERVTGMTAEKAIAAIRETHPRFTEAQWQSFWGDKVLDHAATFQALNERNRVLQAGGLAAEEAITTDRIAGLTAAEHAIRNDPQRLGEAVRNLAGQGQEQFFKQLHHEIALSGMAPKAYLSRDIGQFMAANDHARDTILPYVGQMARETGTDEAHKMLIGASDAPGGVGIARLDSYTRPEALAKAHQFDRELDSLTAREQAIRDGGISTGPAEQLRMNVGETTLPVTAAERNQFTTDLATFLHEEVGITAERMPQDDRGKIDVIRNWAEGLATPIVAHHAAPPELHQAIARLADMGYQPVAGTDIGWRMISASPTDVFAGALTHRRKVLEASGLSPRLASERDIHSLVADGFMTTLQKKIEADPRLKTELPPFTQPNTIWAYLQNKGVIDNPNGYLRGVAQKIARTPERLAKAEGWRTAEGSLDLTRAEQEMNAQISPQALSHAQIKQAFTREKLETYLPAAATEQNARAEAARVAGVPIPDGPSDYFISAVQDSIRQAYAQLPTRYIGAQKIENLFRASMGFAGKGLPQRAAAGAIVGSAAALVTDPDNPNWGKELAGAVTGGIIGAAGGDRLGYALANLPNNLINLRNQLRFDLDPTFDARRLVKANIKMAAEGLPMTSSPLRAMKAAGTLTYDRQALAEATSPEIAGRLAEADDATLIATRAGIWGYNPHNIEAYIAGNLKRAGASPDDIKAGIIRIMHYGTGTISGRSPLERSINFVFFPFSFEKTLYRNLGGYLLDRPAQRIVLTRALAEYDDFNKNHMDGSNPLATSFWTKHAPLANELVQLNAFAHGLSFGEPGGINRPLLNLFLPQSWSASKDNTANLQRFIPMVKALGRVLDETKQQVPILEAAISNSWHDLHGIPGLQSILGEAAGYTYSAPPKSTLSTQAQMDAAFAMQRDWFTKYSSILEYNAKAASDKQLHFPIDPIWGDYQGLAITKTNVRNIIHGYYPAYSPNGAVIAATTNSTDWNAYVRGLRGNPLQTDVQQFADDAHTLGKVMNSNRASATLVSQYTDALRQQAMRLAEKDSQFYKLYQKNFGKLLGPLEAIR